MSASKGKAAPKTTEITLLFSARISGKVQPAGAKVDADPALLADLLAAKCAVVSTETDLDVVSE